MTGIEKRVGHIHRSQEEGACCTMGGHTGKCQDEQEAEEARGKCGFPREKQVRQSRQATVGYFKSFQWALGHMISLVVWSPALG